MKNKMLRIGIAGLLFAGVTLFSLSARDTQTPKVRWLESPITARVTNYSTNGFSMDSLWESYRATDGNIQIGLREDGVVVWRHR